MGLKRFIDDLSIRHNDDVLLREQYRSLTHMVPFLYTVCITVSLMLMFIFNMTAPIWMAYYVPAGLAVAMLMRRVYWRRMRSRVDEVAMDLIRRDLKSTQMLGPVFTFAFTLLGLGLMRYSDQFDQSLTILAIWVTAIASAFCLSALPIAAVAVIVSAAVPMVIGFALMGEPRLIMLAFIFSIVSGMLVSMLIESYKRFADMVKSRAMLDEKQKQTEAAHHAAHVMAHTDALTGLHNRRYFEKFLLDYVSRPDIADRTFAIGMLDLDGFKPINDIYGHGAGDEVLVQISARLKQVMVGRGELARMGGDEFAIFAEGLSAEADIMALGQAMKEALEQPIPIGSIVARLTCSSGFAIYPVSGTDPERLIDRADMALYKAKAHERGSTRIFSSDFETSAFERATIEQELRAAIAAQALDVHFQPIVGLESGELTGFEALARWTHPTLGPISPGVFVPIAEQIGIVEAMTDVLLRKACQIAATWPSHLMLAFNLSVDQLVKPNAGLKLISILAECNFPPQRFEAEVTETAIMKDVSAARLTIVNLKAAGCRVSLDDFGTGYSSLSQIRDLPLDKIKIDKSFVDHICSDEKIGSIVRSIINMCGHLDLGCVAEGIEQRDQLRKLKLEGCNHGQGYLFSRPLPEAAAAELIAEMAGRTAAHADQPAVRAA